MSSGLSVRYGPLSLDYRAIARITVVLTHNYHLCGKRWPFRSPHKQPKDRKFHTPNCAGRSRYDMRLGHIRKHICRLCCIRSTRCAGFQANDEYRSHQRDLSACHLATIRYTKKLLRFSFWWLRVARPQWHLIVMIRWLLSEKSFVWLSPHGSRHLARRVGRLVGTLAAQSHGRRGLVLI